MPHIPRRRFVTALAAAAAGTWSPRLLAQGGPRIGILSLEPVASVKPRVDAFKRALAKLGHAGVEYIHLSAEGARERLPGLAEALVARKPAAIVSESSLTTLPLRNATATIPIVMAACDDPLASRFVRALEAPGGNVTGVAVGVREELPAPVAILARVLPKGATFAGIFNPANAMYRKARAGLHYGAVQHGLAIAYLDVVEPAQLERAFAEARREKVAAIVVVHDPMFVAERARFVKLAASLGRPAIFPERSFVRAGGMASHGPSLEQAFARAAAHVHRILGGAAPGALAVESAGKYEFVVSRKAPAAFRKGADALL